MYEIKKYLQTGFKKHKTSIIITENEAANVCKYCSYFCKGQNPMIET